MIPDLPDEVRSILDARFAAREKAISGSRLAIRSAANGIRALHRGEWQKAETLISESGSRLAAISDAVAANPELWTHAVVNDAAKEYAEARVTQAMFTGAEIPSFGELDLDPVPYLHGLGEAVGEMRRRMLDLLREERIAEAEAIVEQMDAIVDLLAQVDYPDGMTNSLRRTTDIARALSERSRSDLTATIVQERLRQDLREHGSLGMGAQ
ncbi:MAG TPA: haloacid dehalogenase [Acidimicrobiia bacterium]|nr:haloacid dehalogenase [Acidimicrobiia bacterium]